MRRVKVETVKNLAGNPELTKPGHETLNNSLTERGRKLKEPNKIEETIDPDDMNKDDIPGKSLKLSWSSKRRRLRKELSIEKAGTPEGLQE